MTLVIASLLVGYAVGNAAFVVIAPPVLLWLGRGR